MFGHVILIVLPEMDVQLYKEVNPNPINET